jgi:hypothetical protein
MRILDIVTVEEIVHSMDDNNPREGIGNASSEDLKPSCKALVMMAIQEAMGGAQKHTGAPSRMRNIWMRAKRMLLRRKWGAKKAVKNVPVLIAGIQMVDLALRKKGH